MSPGESNIAEARDEGRQVCVNAGQNGEHQWDQAWQEQHVRNQLNVIEESIDSNYFWENWKTLNKQQHKELQLKLEVYIHLGWNH